MSAYDKQSDKHETDKKRANIEERRKEAAVKKPQSFENRTPSINAKFKIELASCQLLSQHVFFGH